MGSFEGGTFHTDRKNEREGFAAASKDGPMDFRFDDDGVKIEGVEHVPIKAANVNAPYVAEPLRNNVNAEADQARRSLESEMQGGGAVEAAEPVAYDRAAIPRNVDTPVVATPQEEIIAAKVEVETPEVSKEVFGSVQEEEIVEVTEEDEQRADEIFKRFQGSLEVVHGAAEESEETFEEKIPVPEPANDNRAPATEQAPEEVIERVPFTAEVDAESLGLEPITMTAEGFNGLAEEFADLYHAHKQELVGRNLPGIKSIEFDRAYDAASEKLRDLQRLFIDGSFDSGELQAGVVALNKEFHNFGGCFESLKEYLESPEEVEMEVSKEEDLADLAPHEEYNEALLAEEFMGAQSFGELYAVLDKVEEIEFEGRPFSSRLLHATIEQFRNGQLPAEEIIPALSLRDVAVALKAAEDEGPLVLENPILEDDGEGLTHEEFAAMEAEMQAEEERTPAEQLSEFIEELDHLEKDLEDSKKLMRTDNELDIANYQASLRVQKFRPKAEELRAFAAKPNPTEADVQKAEGIASYLEALRTDIVKKEQADVWQDARENLAHVEEMVVEEKQIEVDAVNNKNELVEFQKEMQADLTDTKKVFMAKMGFLREGVRQFDDANDRSEYNSRLNAIEKDFSRSYAEINSVAESAAASGQDVTDVQRLFAEKYDLLNDHVEALFALDSEVFDHEETVNKIDEIVTPFSESSEETLSEEQVEAKPALAEIDPPKKETPEIILQKELTQLGKKGAKSPEWNGGLFQSAAKDMELRQFLQWAGGNKANPVTQMIDRMKERAGAFVPREEEKMTVEDYVKKLAVGIAKAQRTGNVNQRQEMLKKSGVSE